MPEQPQSQTEVLDFEPEVASFYRDVVEGLSQQTKTLPCKYFYDHRGSQLFDQICELDEYYPTRTELAIIQQHAGEMAEQIGPEVMLIEYGSGSSIKTRILLDHLIAPVAYVPVDISRKHLQQTANELARRYPDIEILPVCADFTEDFQLPVAQRTPSHVAVYFPGSTIGNFAPEAGQAMLQRLVGLCGCGGGLLIGIDLQKDLDVIKAAYNDAQGVTAAFNLNLLHRINRELDTDIDVDSFEHAAVYDQERNRIEMQLRSCAEQTIRIGQHEFDLAAGEPIVTEHSHKYTIERFAKLAAAAGLTLRRAWTDERDYFAVLHLAILD